MAHEVESMIYVGEKPWHGLGKKFETPPSLDKALVEAGLAWEVVTEPTYTDRILADGKREVAPALVTRRADTGNILGSVGLNYTPLQNAQAKDFFKPFETAGFVEVETAGSLDEGRKVFFLCKIKENSILQIKGNDIVQKYVLLSNSHDGTLAVRAGFTPIRVVCANTLALAHSVATSKLLRLKHTKNLVENLDRVRDIMNLANQAFEATAEQYRFLASRQVNRHDLETYVKQIFVPAAQVVKAKEGNKLGQRILAEITPLFEAGRGNDLPEIRGTWWAAYNAVTEHLNYSRGSSRETRLNQVWFGSSAALNQEALTLAVKLAA